MKILSTILEKMANAVASEFFKFGAIAVVTLLCVGVGYLVKQQDKTAGRVTALEHKLLECYESRVNDLKAQR